MRVIVGLGIQALIHLLMTMIYIMCLKIQHMTTNWMVILILTTETKQAYNAVQQAGQNYVNVNNVTGLVDNVVMNVNGFDITVRGVVVDGVFKIRTFFIP